MRSTDGGETWQDHRPGAQRGRPLARLASARRRAARTRRAAAAPPGATTRGETWHPADEGRDRNYTWSVAVDPDDPELWYVSASTGPFAAHGGGDPQALIYRRREGDVERARRRAARAAARRCRTRSSPRTGGLVAGFADGQIWGSADHGDSWQPLRAPGRPAHGAARPRLRELTAGQLEDPLGHDLGPKGI